jgi:hypothetical protein
MSTKRAKTPTQKAAALKNGSDSDDDMVPTAPEKGSLPYSRKQPYHERMKTFLGDGSLDPITCSLSDYLLLHPEYKKFKQNSLRSAFNDMKREFTTRVAVEGADRKGG